MTARFNVMDNDWAAKFGTRFAGIGLALDQSSLPKSTHLLVQIRSSQINGCGFCCDMHTKDAVAAGETSLRLNLIAAWREAPMFTEAERAALELTEEGTRIADSAGCPMSASARWPAPTSRACSRSSQTADRVGGRRQNVGGVVETAAMGLTLDEKQQFLAEPHVAALSVAEVDRAPLTVPVWYDYLPGGTAWMQTGLDSRKLRALRAAGRFSLMVDTVAPRTKYVTVEGSITEIVRATDAEIEAMAARYLSGEALAAYLKYAHDVLGEHVTVRLQPEHWLGADLTM